MSRTIRILITLVLLGAFAAALYFSLRERKQDAAREQEAAEVASAVALKGVISLDVEAFFKDERVLKVLAAHKLPVQVTRVGSREMAQKVAAGEKPDFFFPSGVVAANQIVDEARRANIPAAQSSPFHTPMVIASWEPVAGILVANGLATRMQPKVYGVDMARLTEAMLAKKRWKDFKDA
ncbi:MAG: hypothetical protein EPO12_06500, partial [Aquabacterium sp.]